MRKVFRFIAAVVVIDKQFSCSDTVSAEELRTFSVNTRNLYNWHMIRTSATNG